MILKGIQESQNQINFRVDGNLKVNCLQLGCPSTLPADFHIGNVNLSQFKTFSAVI